MRPVRWGCGLSQEGLLQTIGAVHRGSTACRQAFHVSPWCGAARHANLRLRLVWCWIAAAAQADIISAVEFDYDGLHLATGDRGGRVVLFERVNPHVVRTAMSGSRRARAQTHACAGCLLLAVRSDAAFLTTRFSRHVHAQRNQAADQRAPPPLPRGASFEYRYMTEFQSHEPEFDYLKSLEIEEKINKVRWCRSSNNTRMLLSTNDKTVKLWKVRCACGDRVPFDASSCVPLSIHGVGRVWARRWPQAWPPSAPTADMSHTC